MIGSKEFGLGAPDTLRQKNRGIVGCFIVENGVKCKGLAKGKNVALLGPIRH